MQVGVLSIPWVKMTITSLLDVAISVISTLKTLIKFLITYVISRVETKALRGFDYKSLSPVVDGFKVGGQALAVGSMEYNYQFKERLACGSI